MIKWGTLELHDFLSWKDLKINLTPGKPTLILGDNQDNAGASSNGSGKSAIFDGLLWTLFGTTLRGLTGDDVIRQEEDQATGKVKWSVDGKSFEVNRLRKKGETELGLVIGSTPVGGITASITQKRIESAIGFQFETFVAACIFGQDVTRWATYTDKDQKLILERLIGLSQWDQILKEVRDGRQAQGLAKQLSEASLASAERDLKEAEESKEALDKEESDWQASIVSKTDDISGELERLSREIKSLSADLTSKTEALEELRKESAGAEIVRQTRENMKIERAKAESRQARAKEILKDLDEEQADLDLHTIGDPCPVCERPLDEGSAEAANRGHQRKITSIEDRRKELDSELSQVERTLETELPPEPNAEILNRVQTANDDLSDIKNQLYKKDLRKTQLLAEVERLTTKAQSFGESRVTIEKRIKTLEAKRDQMVQEADEAHKNKLSYDWLEKAFGPQGIRSFLLESILPRFEEWVNATLAKLGPNLRLELRAQTALKSGELREKLRCEVFLDGRVSLYDSLSAGERQRVDVAIALGLETLSAERTPAGLAVFDEIFERMDPEGCERVVRLLRARFSETGCWIITHNDALRSLFSDVLVVRKENGISFLAQ